MVNRSISVLLLAAGYGSRLSPYTNDWPKCLMPIGGIPLLGHWLGLLKDIGLDRVLVNTHYLAPTVEAYLKRTAFSGWVDCVYESQLMGTAGTVRANNEFFINSTLLLIHADNFCQCDFEAFLRYHQMERPKDCPITMMTFDTPNPSACGIAETNAVGVVTGFHEKVSNPPGNLANGAVYLLEPEVLEWICTHPDVTDFSTQVLPNFLGRIATWHNREIHVDIGTIESLRKVQDCSIPKGSVKISATNDDWQKMFMNHPIHRQLKN